MRNDTGGPLLVRARLDPGRGTVTVAVYGLPGARRVAVSRPIVLERGLLTRTRITRTVVDGAGARTDLLLSSYRPGG
jgi:hypothetical protein